MRSYLGKLREAFAGVDAADFANLPLFSDAAGNVFKNNQVVTISETDLSSRGLPNGGNSGRRPFGGHSYRVTGSRCWVALGLEVFMLQVSLLAEVPHQVVFRRCLLHPN